MLLSTTEASQAEAKDTRIDRRGVARVVMMVRGSDSRGSEQERSQLSSRRPKKPDDDWWVVLRARVKCLSDTRDPDARLDSVDECEGAASTNHPAG